MGRKPGINTIQKHMNINSRFIKSELAKEFGRKSVSVKQGTGTASSWIDVRVNIDHVKGCTCSTFERATTCRQGAEAAYAKIKEVIQKLKQEGKIKLYTFSSDDGQGSEMDCISTQVELNKKIRTCGRCGVELKPENDLFCYEHSLN